MMFEKCLHYSKCARYKHPDLVLHNTTNLSSKNNAFPAKMKSLLLKFLKSFKTIDSRLVHSADPTWPQHKWMYHIYADAASLGWGTGGICPLRKRSKKKKERKTKKKRRKRERVIMWRLKGFSHITSLKMWQLQGAPWLPPRGLCPLPTGFPPGTLTCLAAPVYMRISQLNIELSC